MNETLQRFFGSWAVIGFIVGIIAILMKLVGY